MATWTAITVADLKTGKAADVVLAFATVALGAGQPDPTNEVIINATERIRTEIQSSSVNVMSATPHAIPTSLKSLAVRLILWDLQSRLNTIGGTFEPNDQEKQDHRDDLRYLERIARGEVTIEIPDDPSSTPLVERGGEVETIGERPIKVTREAMAHL